MVQKHFKIEGTPTLEDLIRPNNFGIAYDLKEALQPHPNPSIDAEFTGNDVQKHVFYLLWNALRSE
jgi:hypothetical protein